MTGMSITGGVLLAAALGATAVTSTNTWRPCEERTVLRPVPGAEPVKETSTFCAPLSATDGFPLLAALVGGALLLPELLWRVRPIKVDTPAVRMPRAAGHEAASLAAGRWSVSRSPHVPTRCRLKCRGVGRMHPPRAGLNVYEGMEGGTLVGG